MKIKEKSQKAITLIALIITIIILLILAGVTIITLTGENGLLARARVAKNTNSNATIEENVIMDDYLAKIDSILFGSNRDGNGIINESNVLASLTSDVVQAGKNLNVTINPTFNDGYSSTDIGEYIVVSNGNYIGSTTLTSYIITPIQASTKYEIIIIAVDKKVNMKMSDSTVFTTSDKNYVAQATEYPVLTLNGLMNVKYVCDIDENDYYYEYDPSVTTTVANPMPINCYNRDKTTYSTLLNGIDYRIQVDESCIDKYVSIYCQKLNNSYPYGYINFYTSANSTISGGYLQNITGESSDNLSVKSVKIPSGTKYIGLGSGTIGGPTFNVYDIWCSGNDNLTGTTY